METKGNNATKLRTSKKLIVYFNFITITSLICIYFKLNSTYLKSYSLPLLKSGKSVRYFEYSITRRRIKGFV